VVSTQQAMHARALTRQVYMDEKIEQYIVDLVFATRQPTEYGLGKFKQVIQYGGSPRASINLALAAKAHAFLQQRAFVIPEDVKAISKDVLRHRIGLTYEAEAENITTEHVVEGVLKAVNVP
jgi:MoxR-like ATPase